MINPMILKFVKKKLLNTVKLIIEDFRVNLCLQTDRKHMEKIIRLQDNYFDQWLVEWNSVSEFKYFKDMIQTNSE